MFVGVHVHCSCACYTFYVNMLYLIGRMIAVSLVQGAQAPLCFAQPVADFLVFEKIRCAPCVDDITDYEIREKLKKVIQFIQLSTKA